MVYILRQPHKKSSYIKIGHSVNVPKRIKSHQSSSPVILELLGLKNGMKKEETDLHRMLHEFRLNGEWFTDCPEVLEALDILDPRKSGLYKRKHYPLKQLELFFVTNRYAAYEYETLMNCLDYSLEYFPPEALHSFAFKVKLLEMNEIPDRHFVGMPYIGKRWIIYAGDYFESQAKFYAELPCFSDME